MNVIAISGNLTRDPVLSYTPNQMEICDFGIANNDGGENRTVFVDCVAFKKTATAINEYMAKGRRIFIQGSLMFDTWTAQDGTKRSKHKVLVNRWDFGDSKPKEQQQGSAAPPQDEDIPF